MQRHLLHTILASFLDNTKQLFSHEKDAFSIMMIMLQSTCYCWYWDIVKMVRQTTATLWASHEVRFTTSTANYVALDQKSSWSCWSSKGSLSGKTSTRQQYTSLPAGHTYLQRHWLSSMKIGDPSLTEATYLDCIAIPWSSINIKASQHNLNSYYDLKHYAIKEYSLWHIIQHESSCCSKHSGSSWSTLYCNPTPSTFPPSRLL